MKDVFNRKVNAGDYVVYTKNCGSSITFDVSVVTRTTPKKCEITRWDGKTLVENVIKIPKEMYDEIKE